MFTIFRIILIFFSIACTVLTAFAVTGSFKNERFLTNTYLVNVHLTSLNTSALINMAASGANIQKRATSTIPQVAAGSKDVWGTVTSTAAEVWQSAQNGDISGAESSIIQTIDAAIPDISYRELGLPDVYSFSYWGYCRGYIIGDITASNNHPFDNNKVNYTWCSPAQVGFQLKPIDLFKTELNNTLNNRVNGLPAGIQTAASTYSNQLQLLLNSIGDDNLQLPGNLNENIDRLNTVTVVSFGFLLTACVLSAISVIIQLLAFFFSPNSCCLTFLNFLFQVLVLIVVLVASATATGVFFFVRGQINDHTNEFGMKSFLSINFYAFAWSAAAAALLVVLFGLLGHCCGLFGTGRRRYRAVQPPVAYDHKEDMVESDSD
ncbi:hypothetical protein G9P44_002180 [Scheffersomyces stipitis]|nr:hypothetical protein G9P44_002180 [Scheffersomyces stipitis]